MTVAQKRLYAEIIQIKTVGQLRAYIATKANRVIALLNASRRLRGEPPLVRKSGIRPVQFVPGIGTGTGLLSAQDVSSAITNNLISGFNGAKESGNVTSQLQSSVNLAINQAVQQNVTGGAPLSDPQKRQQLTQAQL